MLEPWSRLARWSERQVIWCRRRWRSGGEALGEVLEDGLRLGGTDRGDVETFVGRPGGELAQPFLGVGELDADGQLEKLQAVGLPMLGAELLAKILPRCLLPTPGVDRAERPEGAEVNVPGARSAAANRR